MNISIILGLSWNQSPTYVKLQHNFWIEIVLKGRLTEKQLQFVGLTLPKSVPEAAKPLSPLNKGMTIIFVFIFRGVLVGLDTTHATPYLAKSLSSN